MLKQWVIVKIVAKLYIYSVGFYQERCLNKLVNKTVFFKSNNIVSLFIPHFINSFWGSKMGNLLSIYKLGMGQLILNWEWDNNEDFST